MADTVQDVSGQTIGAVGRTANAELISRAVANTEAAFRQLVAALDAEARVHSAIGGEVFFRGTPKESRPVLRSAGLFGQLRDHIKYLHSMWEKDDLTVMGHLKVQDSEPRAADPASRPLKFRRIQGMPAGEAAKKLGVKPVTVRSWLESGMLKGHRSVNGKWRIPQIELVAFSKKYPDLVGRIN
jgi:excisionase family DNA binding protein